MDHVTEINDDTMLPLNEAARRAFPAGGVTGDTLKRRIRKGELRAYKIGKAYHTTLSDIRAMRALLAVPAKRVAKPAPLMNAGLTAMELSSAALDATLAKATALKKKTPR